ncbi:hypothetical protein Droror1_Dr00015132 [Drosera rotundifolia]
MGKALSKIAQNLLEKELVEWQVNLPAGFKHKVNDANKNLAGPNPTPSDALLKAEGSPRKVFKNDNKANIKVIGAASGAAAFGIAVVVSIAMYPKRKSDNTSWLPIYGAFTTQGGKSTIGGSSVANAQLSSGSAANCRHFSLQEIKKATKNFDESHAKAHARLLLPLQPGKAQLLHSLLEKISRNKMCPFGSKEKYKACCEAVAERASSKSMKYVSYMLHIAAISEADIIEIAWGLEASKVPFLGCIVSWVSQKRVLAHPTIGGFWSHCGWNSTLNPFFGDHFADARYVTSVWKVGLELKNDMFKR